MELCDDDPEHSLQVARLALQLHDALGGPLGLGDAERELLEAAALLSNVVCSSRTPGTTSTATTSSGTPST